MFRRQLEEVELAERIGIDQIWFFEHHLQPTAPVPSPNLLIAAASRTTRHIRFSSMVNILPFRHPLLVAEEAAMLDNLTGGRLDMGLGRGLRPPEFDADGVDQQQSREMFLESFDIIRRVWADENFVHRGKYWTVRKDAPLSPPLVQHPHPPFLVSAQSEESLCWAAEHDIPFAQIDATVEQARHDQAFYREVQTAHGHAPVRRLYLMREIYVGDNDARARAEARPYLLQYWELRHRYTQFTRGGKLPDSYDFRGPAGGNRRRGNQHNGLRAGPSIGSDNCPSRVRRSAELAAAQNGTIPRPNLTAAKTQASHRVASSSSTASTRAPIGHRRISRLPRPGDRQKSGEPCQSQRSSRFIAAARPPPVRHSARAR
jgi:alkanesulfonate monooxygenase SsuD/methylene tetrahydromethanopterin reductase-like flavin-dependent oxidoreductase (luciferase family)